MLRLKTIGPNCHEVTDGDVSVLFSYATPVAAHVSGVGYFRTDAHHSVTTSRHINAYAGKAAAVVTQDCLERMALTFNAVSVPA